MPINIRGKSYVLVNERVKEFKTSEKYAGLSIETELLQFSPDSCVAKASIKDSTGRVLATAHAQEVRTNDASDVNSTSHIENAETSAVGRALGFIGIGIDSSIASADEVNSAINRQETLSQAPRAVRKPFQAPQPSLSPTAQTEAAANQENNKPKLGDIALIEGVECIVRARRVDGGLFWAAKDPNIKFTRPID